MSSVAKYITGFKIMICALVKSKSIYTQKNSVSETMKGSRKRSINFNGFPTQIWKDSGYYIATIRPLHINTQAKTIKKLKENLEECLELTKEEILAKQINKSEFSNKVVEEIKARLFLL
jgi:predicted RNase H-like HicB family nuclease